MKKVLFSSLLVLLFFMESLVVFGLEINDRDTSPVEYFIKEGRKYSNTFFYYEAAKIYKKGIELYPDNWDLHKGFINLNSSFNQIYSIVSFYVENAEKNNQSHIWFSGAAICNFIEGNPATAEHYLDKATKLAPDSLPVSNAKAILNTRDSKEADKYYEQLLNKYPCYSDGYIEFLDFITKKRLFDTKYAKEYYERGIKCKDIDPIIYVFRVNIESESLMYDENESVKIYQEILSKDNSQTLIKSYLARSYSDLGDKESELKTLQEITLQSPQWTRGWISLSNHFRKFNQYDKANFALEKVKLCPFQEGDKVIADYLHAENLYYQQKFDEAVVELKRFIDKYRTGVSIKNAQKLLSVIISRDPEEKIKIIDNIPYLAQKGNYCGPATLSVILDYWGVKKTQDEIADSIYTGVVGTAPQVIEAYCKSLGFKVITFRGNEKNWKALIDQDIPVLWLKQLKQGAHYMVVTGYDDLSNRFILHNPNFSTRTDVKYDETDDEWIFPSLNRSLIIVPEDKMDKYDFSMIEGSLLLEAINSVFYIISGSNLFKGFFPEILLNLLFTGIIIAAGGLIIKKRTFPYNRFVFPLYMAVNLLFLLLVNYIVYKYHYSKAVSIMIAYHFALICFLLVLVFYKAMFFLAQDYFSPGETVKLGFTIFLVFTCSVYFEKEGWEIIVPVIILCAGAVFSLHLRFQVYYFLMCEKNKEYNKAFHFYRKYGSESKKGHGLFSAYLKELMLERKLGNSEKVIELALSLLSMSNLTRYHINHLNRVLLEAEILSAEKYDEVSDEILLKIEHLLIDSFKTNPNSLEKVYLNILFASFLTMKKEYRKAEEITIEAFYTLTKPNLMMKIYRFLQKTRGFKDEFDDFELMNSLNLIIISKYFDKDDTIKMIKEKFERHFDRRFRMQSRLLELIENNNSEKRT